MVDFTLEGYEMCRSYPNSRRLAVGLFAIGIVVLELNSVDLCYELQHQNWTSVPKKIQNIIVTADTIRSFPSQLWSILLMITMFGWHL